MNDFLEFAVQLTRKEVHALVRAITAYDQHRADSLKVMRRYGVDGPTAREYKEMLLEDAQALQTVRHGLERLLARKKQ